MINPLQLMREAIRNVPAVKYALGVAGVVSGIAIIAALGVDLRIAAFGTVVMVVLMVLLLIFARLTTVRSGHFVIPILVLLWSSIILTMATATLLFSSIFFRWPVDLRYWLGKPSVPLMEIINRDATPIPESQLPSDSQYDPNSGLEFTDVTWDRPKKVIDIKVRNKSNDSLVISKLIAIFEFRPNPPIGFAPTEKLEFVPKRSEPRAATQDDGFYRAAKGYLVSYMVPPHGADRYLLSFDLDPDTLKGRGGGGEYFLTIKLDCNGRTRSTEVSLSELLSAQFHN